jgi:hypothetical protein
MQTVSTIGFDIAMEQRANVDVEIAMRKLALKSPRRRDHHGHHEWTCTAISRHGVVSPQAAGA